MSFSLPTVAEVGAFPALTPADRFGSLYLFCTQLIDHVASTMLSGEAQATIEIYGPVAGWFAGETYRAAGELTRLLGESHAPVFGVTQDDMPHPAAVVMWWCSVAMASLFSMSCSDAPFTDTDVRRIIPEGQLAPFELGLPVLLEPQIQAFIDAGRDGFSSRLGREFLEMFDTYREPTVL